jgi:hypothetical protein
MRIISFAWTTPALVARRKTVTRRAWQPSYAASMKDGQLCAAWDKSPRAKGKKVGVIRLVGDPFLESTALMPASDFEAEGFNYLGMIGATVNGWSPRQLWEHSKRFPTDLWVVRFEIVSLEGESVESG